MESNVEKFEVVTNELIDRIKEVFKTYSGYKCDVYSGEYTKVITISDPFRDVRIDFDKIIPASMHLDRATKLQVRVYRDNWFDVITSIPVDDDSTVPTVLKALDEYFSNRINGVIKDLTILNSCRFTKMWWSWTNLIKYFKGSDSKGLLPFSLFDILVS